MFPNNFLGIIYRSYYYFPKAQNKFLHSSVRNTETGNKFALVLQYKPVNNEMFFLCLSIRILLFIIDNLIYV